MSSRPTYSLQLLSSHKGIAVKIETFVLSALLVISSQAFPLGESAIASPPVKPTAKDAIASHSVKPTAGDAIASHSVKPTAGDAIASPAVKQATKSAISSNAQLKVEKRKRTKPKKGFKITIEYPFFSGGTVATTTKLNELVKRACDANFAEADITPEKGVSYDFSSDYTVSAVNGDFVSILMSFYSFTGGAHGNTVLVPFNYRLSTDGIKEINIDNVFGKKPDVGALQKLIRPQLIKQIYPDGQNIDKETIEKGTRTAQDFKCFTLKKDSITFTFQQYQVAFYAAGTPDVTLKFADIHNLFDKDSPVWKQVELAKAARTL